jgi:hypothetical protein
METFIFTLKHDTGKIRITVSASSMGAAFDKVMAAEGCPRSAIKRVVTADTKRLLYNG